MLRREAGRRVVVTVTQELDSALAELLARSHTAAPSQLAGLVEHTAHRLGMAEAALYLADVQQDMLVPLPDARACGEEAEPIPIDGTLAGWAYRTVSPRLTKHGSLTVWLPLVDGVERVGVVRITAAQLTARMLEAAEALASLATLIIVSMTGYSDLYARVARREPMNTAAEMVWAFLPPLTLGTDRVTSTAVLEPAYEIGGDAFDHGLDDGRLHLTILDAMGHDLGSGLASAIALASCRSVRRACGPLLQIAEHVDAELERWLPGISLTGVFADLDLDSGLLTWVNCGHPPPLLIRGRRVVPRALEARGELPLGLRPQYQATRTVHQAQLEPGDRLLLHTDGVTEARSAAGELFGEQRLVDFVLRSLAAEEPPPEALRRLIHAILEHHDDRLRDDATIVLAAWHPDRGTSEALAPTRE